MRFPFTTEARTQLRAIDRPVALRILETFAQFGESGVGDVSPLHGEWQGCFRLRCGDVLSNALELSTLAVPTPAVRTPLGEPGIGMAVGIDIRTVKEVEGISELMCGNGNGQATWRMIFASCSRI